MKSQKFWDKAYIEALKIALSNDTWMIKGVAQTTLAQRAELAGQFADEALKARSIRISHCSQSANRYDTKGNLS